MATSAVDLPADTSSASAARRFVAERLASLDASELFDTAVLLVSELVTNAVLHARSAVRLEVARNGGRLRISVTDDSPYEPVVRDSFDLEAGTGRGLMLVEALAADWGTDAADGGKTVWVELERELSAC